MIQHMQRPLAVKSLGDDGSFVGYASVFGKVDSQNEVVAPGAFRRTLANGKAQMRVPAMLWMHDPTAPIGLWLQLAEDKNGLAVEGRLALSTQKGREAYELLKMGAIDGLSIGYRVVSSRIDSKRKVRVLTDVELFEISLVTFPSNDAARVSAVKMPRRPSSKKQASAARGRVAASTDTEATRAIVARLHQAARVLKQDSSRRG